MTFLIICWTLTAIFVSASIVFQATSNWYTTQSRLWRTNYSAAEQREANKPWYVRAADPFLGGKR